MDVPYDVTDRVLREKYRQALYGEWSHDLHAIVKTHQDVSDKLPQHVDLLLKEKDGNSHLRHFFVTADVPEFSFPGSYRLELYLIPKNAQQTSHVVNSVSVLGRANSDNCPACRDRRAAGSQIRGYMHLDPRVVLYLLSQLDPTQLAAITDLDALTVLIQGSFGMRLVKPDGTRLAAADPNIDTNRAPLDDAKTPQLTLHSQIISLKPGDTASPAKFQDAVTHGTFGEGSEWKAF